MSKRFREICDLLIQGTANGRLHWEVGYSPDVYSTRFGTYLISIERSLYDPPEFEAGSMGSPVIPADHLAPGKPRQPSINLGVLSENGDELESVSSDDSTDDEAGLLRSLWRAVRGRWEQAQDARLKGLADTLRATLATSPT